LRLRKNVLIDPQLNGFFAVSAVAVSFFVFAYSIRLGQVPIVIYYALWLPLIFVGYRQTLGAWQDLLLPFFIALWCLASVIWSDAPSITLRGGFQFASHILCAVIAARVASFRSLALGAVVGCFFVVLYSFSVGEYAVDTLDGSFTFVGAFGSKNQLGFFSSLCIYFAIVALFSMRIPIPTRIFCVAALVAAGVALAWCRSATSIASLVAGVATCLGLMLCMRFSPMVRAGVLAVAALACVLFVAVEGGFDLVLGLMGRDATLTGRTYLWAEGLNEIFDKPFLGYGYRAWWIEGRSKAEELWELFYITSKSGFHFHNLYLEATVEVGVVGLVLLVIMIVLIASRYTRSVLTSQHRDAPALMGLLVMMLVRSFVEVDFLGAYAPGSFLMVWMLCSSRDIARRNEADAA
jgi:exopolysaccharide production protein ExoQ